MAPVEDLTSRDLAWISDFVMQQMVIMMRPMMDHLQQTDGTADYTQRQVQRLSMDISELRGDIERTNKYLAILRQGLGVQNEGKCVLQRSLEGTTRTVKRLDEQTESLLTVMRGVEDSFSQMCSDFRGANLRHEELSSKVTESSLAIHDLQAKVERISTDAHLVKDDLLNSEARLEVWHRELRDIRRNQISLVPKLEEKGSRAPPSSQSVRPAPDQWPQKKSFASVEVNGGGNTPGAYTAASTFGDCTSNHSGSSQQSKRISRVDSSSSRSRAALLPQDHISFPASTKATSRVWSPAEGTRPDGGASSEEAHENARLPSLAVRAGMARPGDRNSGSEGPRLRFTATMAEPASRGCPN
eukprot:TRINITY_DN68786_c0_g1_i1.p1 TRINITY_DN68786_c0_g1~~TRINITY_DN68786_c0_g1_i1.p1  ORF type:complete len:357 (+),score=81.90 TRINITY_DN68786_c0_g1_i1:59-1129(+)